MKLRAFASVLAALLLAAPAMPTAAQDPEAGAEVESAIPDVPSGPATLRGQVVRADASVAAADVEVLLYALPSAGSPGLRRARTDADGRFVFEGISDAPTTAYLVGARYRGVPFPGARIVFPPGEREREVSLRVGATSSDPTSVDVARAELRLRWVGDRLAVTENHELWNDGEATVYVPAEDRASARPAFRAELPVGAEGFATPLGITPEALVRDGSSLRFFGPVFPSAWDEPGAREQGFSFQYTVPGGSGTRTLTKRFPDGARQVVVIAPEGTPLRIAGGGEPESTLVEGRPAQRWTLDGVAAGAGLELTLEVPEARVNADALRVPEVRVFLELDDAALQVQEQHLIEVAGDTAVVGGPDGPLLRIPLAEGARDVRFDRAAFALGLEADGEGGVSLAGPIPAGETRIDVNYRLPAAATTVFEKRFDRALPLLTIYVADTGMKLESERLHPRRPVRTPDRTYLQMEAFQVEPGEKVALALTPIVGAATPGRGVRYGLVALLAALATVFLLGPLRGDEPEADEVPMSDERREREALYAALRDLEHDFETGKVADEDYERMRLELRGRALALLREERRVSEAAGPAAPAAESSRRACASCDTPLREGDRFCSQCGAPLQRPPGRPA